MNIKRNGRNTSKQDDSQIMKQLFDINTLEFYCRYVISMNQNVKTSGLHLVKEMFDHIDENLYGNDIERVNRIRFIKRGLEARLVKKLNDRSLIIQYINGGITDKQLIDTSNMEEVSDETLTYLNEQANELSKSYFVEDLYEQLLLLSTNLKNSNYSMRADIVNQIQSTVSDLHMRFNKMDDAISESTMFSLIPGEFENGFSDIYNRETSPSKILRTGITGLNAMMDGGFQANRVYILFAQAAGGKSFTMLDLAIQIKNYNRDVQTKDPTKIPTIIFLTMENSQDENVSREFSMISGKSFKDCSLEDSMNIYRSNGLGYDRDTDPIDIVMIYKPNLSINTDYLYTLVDKLRETGREPICVFQDHIKRIRPVNKRNDLRLDLGEIVNEFKSFANAFNIPVITDSHLNRDAAKILDDTSRANKKDLIRSLGSSNVSESHLMIDNCDFGVIINKELDSNGMLYLGFKCIKTRTKCDLELFYQPYLAENTIKLAEDLYGTPLFRRQLKEDQGTTLVRVSRRNDFDDISKEKVSEDDDLFTESVLGAKPAQVTNNILLPRNEYQSQFITVGQPSTPIYPINQQIAQMAVVPESSELDKRLISMKYNDPEAKPGIYILNEFGLVIHDGVEELA